MKSEDQGANKVDCSMSNHIKGHCNERSILRDSGYLPANDAKAMIDDLHETILSAASSVNTEKELAVRLKAGKKSKSTP
ncbi:MAG: hypothetical protein V1775_09200 [Bacteroidota bacterium]